MTADDVVWTYQQHCNPHNAANALSTFAGVLKPSGVRKVDDHTVAFHLEGALRNFPYITSSDNYNVIIVPEGHRLLEVAVDVHRYRRVRDEELHAERGCRVRPQPALVGRAGVPRGPGLHVYANANASLLALEGGSLDVIAQFTASGGQAVINNPSQYTLVKYKSAVQRQLSMRCDQAPFTDPRVRQAVALTLNRPQMVKALIDNFGVVGNDSPFAPIFPSTNTSVPQRKQDYAKAKKLLAAGRSVEGLQHDALHRDQRGDPAAGADDQGPGGAGRH